MLFCTAFYVSNLCCFVLDYLWFAAAASCRQEREEEEKRGEKLVRNGFVTSA